MPPAGPLVASPSAAESASGAPMGWSSRALGRSVCEAALRQAALAPLGYRYVVIDGCRQAPQRSDGALAPDPGRFSGGIKALADHLHGKGRTGWVSTAGS
ncbi:hypothetical protein ACIBP6_24780 [Nonomuraea terrae]|uniref:hypothetical protein n=1 Tax=Nonomuraea terrae TaxID=2530383 RepID=UPI00379F14FD